MNKDINPSVKIEEFVQFLKDCRTEYKEAKEKVKEYDSMDRHIYWAHAFEFAKDKNERNRLATAFQKERKERREYKNICDLYEYINAFVNNDSNKSTLKRLEGVIKTQKHQEEYLGNQRAYKGGDIDDTD